MPLLEILALNEYVALLPLMVAFNVGNALKGRGRLEDMHEVMNGAARENLAEEDRGYISVSYIYGKTERKHT